jgi:hypothetical protein
VAGNETVRVAESFVLLFFGHRRRLLEVVEKKKLMLGRCQQYWESNLGNCRINSFLVFCHEWTYESLENTFCTTKEHEPNNDHSLNLIVK